MELSARVEPGYALHQPTDLTPQRYADTTVSEPTTNILAQFEHSIASNRRVGELKCQACGIQPMSLNRRNAVGQAGPALIGAIVAQQQDRLVPVRVNVSQFAVPPNFQDDNISVASSDIPDEAELYFEAARDVYVIDERVTEVEMEYQEVLAARSALHTETEAAQEEADQTREQQLLELIQELSAKYDLLHLRLKACLDIGIDPERFRYRRLSIHDSLSDSVAAWINNNCS